VTVQKVCKCTNTTEIQTIESEQRNKYIKKLKEKGLSIRQISRLTGISKGIVERIS
jgi:transposase